MLIKYAPLYSSGELSASDKAIFTAHAADCQLCKSYLQNETELITFLQNNPVKAPRNLNNLIIAQVKKEVQPRRFFNRQLIYTISAAASVALIIFINLHYFSSPSPEWQNDSNLAAMDELTALETQLLLLDSDYSSTTDEVSEEYDSSDESISLLNALDALE